MYTFTMIIKRNDRFIWLRNTKFHCTMAKLCLRPVCYYLRSIGLGRADLRTDPLDQLEQKSLSIHAGSMGQQMTDEKKVEAAIKASEQRILGAISSLALAMGSTKD